MGKERGQFRVYTEKPKKDVPSVVRTSEADSWKLILPDGARNQCQGPEVSGCQERRRNSIGANRAEMGTQG